ncbi:hypothetical protein MJO29_003781, partial [Puccinia striiformis f. sp. tritici]
CLVRHQQFPKRQQHDWPCAINAPGWFNVPDCRSSVSVTTCPVSSDCDDPSQRLQFGQGWQFASVASSTLNQFTFFMSQMQSAFGGNLGPIFTPKTGHHRIRAPFADLLPPFAVQSFFHRPSSSPSSSLSFDMLPPNFALVMRSIIPGIVSSLISLGLSTYIHQICVLL